MNRFKIIKKIILAFFITIFLVELVARVIIFLITLNANIFFYGILKNISFNIIDLSKLNFLIISEKKITPKKSKFYKKSLEGNILIWTFGGSTTEGFEPNCGHITSSWPNELSKLDENIEIKNFAKKGSTTNYAIQQYFSNFKNKRKPDIILWSNKINEEYNSKIVSSNKNLIMSLKIYKTLKTNFIFFLLYDDFLKKFNTHILKIPEKAIDKVEIQKSWSEAIRNYNKNTKSAINLASEGKSKFYIVSLFTEYDFENNNFKRREFYDVWEKNAKILASEYSVDYIDTEVLFLKEKKIKNNQKYFCDKDNVHQSLLGNKLTAKIIYNYLFDVK